MLIHISGRGTPCFLPYRNISKENTVYIGDSEVDIKTANNAGIDIISVDWGFRKKEFLVENGA